MVDARFEVELVFDETPLNTLKESLKYDNSKTILVGWWDSSNPRHPSTAQVAKINEEGSVGGGFDGNSYVPPRPFIRSGWAPKTVKRLKNKKNKFKGVLEGRENWDDFFKDLAESLQEQMRREIDEWSTPPNSPNTVALKGFNDPLIESGTMRDSVKTDIIPFTKREGK